MTLLSSYDYLDAQISDCLSGDERRVAELFENRSVFDELRARGKDGDWFHFTKKTFDGWYLVEANGGFEAYYHERGGVTDKRAFTNLRDAAAYFFSTSGYVRS